MIMKQINGTYPALSLAELEARIRMLEIRVAHLTELAEAVAATSAAAAEPARDREPC
jgi:hypothetical protein